MATERLQLSVLQDVEPEPKWPQVCNDYKLFLVEIAKRLFVKIDTNLLSESIVKSDIIPQASDRGKVWIKTSWPYGIGFVANGEYQMDYSFTGYPVNIPFLHKDISPLPAHLSEVGDLLLKDYGMEDLKTKTTAPKRMKWYIFSPPQITI